MKDLEEFAATRKSSPDRGVRPDHLFDSLANARALCPDAFDEGPFHKDDILPADLFAGFSPSLEDLNPAGRPKIVLPKQVDFNGWTENQVLNFFKRVFGAMITVFARSRTPDPTDSPDPKGDWISIFEGVDDLKYDLNRSALAAVALMDGLDKDNIPGKFKGKNATVKYWYDLTGLVSAMHEVKGKQVKDAILHNPEKGKEVDLGLGENARTCDYVQKHFQDLEYLNFPCTESAFLLESVYAWITWDPDDFGTQPMFIGESHEYHGSIHVAARVRCLNVSEESHKHKPKVEVWWGSIEGNPNGDTSSGSSGIEWLESDNTKDNLQLVEDNWGPVIDWTDFQDQTILQIVDPQNPDISDIGDEFDDTDSKHRSFTAASIQDRSFTVTVQACSNGLGELKFYPPTRAEYNLNPDYEGFGLDGSLPDPLSASQDVSVPLKAMVKVYDKTDGSFQLVQQVPAPALEEKYPGEWWIRINPCVYHGPASDFGGNPPFGSPAEGNEGNAVGWAYCLVPQFAFDTTSMPAGDKKINFWVCDAAGRSSGGGGVNYGDINFQEPAPELDKYLWTEGNANVVEWLVGWGPYEDPESTTMQVTWLANDGEDPQIGYKPFTEWLFKDSEFRPDCLHAVSSGKASGNQPFHKTAGKYLAEDLYTRIPANGYSCAAELGSVMCGPYETLSLFKAWRMGENPRVDFHPVLDYFTTEKNRAPDIENSAVAKEEDGFDRESGDLFLEDLSDAGDYLYSAAHNGRVNLNAPSLVRASTTSGRGVRHSRRNPFPIASVFNGAKVYGTAGNERYVGERDAFSYAFSLCRTLEGVEADQGTRNVSWGKSSRFSTTNDTVWRSFVRNLSALGAGDRDSNPLLEKFVQSSPEDGSGNVGNGKEYRPANDWEREGLIRATADGFTTRGQTFLAIIRADAYSPKFGENESAEDGATLATTHALVELFRDPVPARAPDGSLPLDSNGRPILYHNWYIRSFRVF